MRQGGEVLFPHVEREKPRLREVCWFVRCKPELIDLSIRILYRTDFSFPENSSQVMCCLLPGGPAGKVTCGHH